VQSCVRRGGVVGVDVAARSSEGLRHRAAALLGFLVRLWQAWQGPVPSLLVKEAVEGV